MKNVYERQNSKCRNAETVETVGSEFPADLTTGQHPLMMMMMMMMIDLYVYWGLLLWSLEKRLFRELDGEIP